LTDVFIGDEIREVFGRTGEVSFGEADHRVLVAQVEAGIATTPVFRITHKQKLTFAAILALKN